MCCREAKVKAKTRNRNRNYDIRATPLWPHTHALSDTKKKKDKKRRRRRRRKKKRCRKKCWQQRRANNINVSLTTAKIPIIKFNYDHLDFWKSYSFHNTSWARQFHTASQLQGGGNKGNEWKSRISFAFPYEQETDSLYGKENNIFDTAFPLFRLPSNTFYFHLGYSACRWATIARPFDSIISILLEIHTSRD